MSIEYSLKIKNNIVNDSRLLSEISKLGTFTNYSISEDSYDLDESYETIGFAITCTKKLNEKLGYETIFLNNNIFYYNQILSCEFNKDFDRTISYKTALKFMFDIMKGVNTEALITNSFFEEICFFKNNQEVIINNALNIWEYTGFQEVLQKWNYSNLI